MHRVIVIETERQRHRERQRDGEREINNRETGIDRETTRQR